MLKHLTIKLRLILLVGFMALMVILLGLNGWESVRAQANLLSKVYHGNVDAIQVLNNITQLYNTDISDTVQKLDDKSIPVAEGLKRVSQTRDKIQKAWEGYLRTELTDDQKRQAIEIQSLMDKANNSLDNFATMVKNVDDEGVKNFVQHEIFAVKDPITHNIAKLIESHNEVTTSAYESALEHERLIALTTIFAVLFSIIFGLFVVRSITTPLKKAVDDVNRLALGNTDIQMEIDSNDEIGQLLHAMQKMINSSNKMIQALSSVAQGDLTVSVDPRSEHDTLGHALNNMIARLRMMIGEIQEEILTLTSSAQEIVSSVTHASASTSETAAAVTETTATAEELKQTAHVAAEKANDVQKRTDDTLNIVKTSEQSLSCTIEDMKQIQNKMNIISESIIKLSENSIAIGEIIDKVNDLAEQSNLLAVNAAIEAAKVGEQGKGFGVVAQEIRLLAEQSKGATVQVRAILHDIQSSTNAAVMATEQGTKAVLKGVNQSQQSNESMHVLTSSISQTAKAADQISISSQQQLVGVDQVTSAIAQINEAANQNVKVIKQIETAVNDMNRVGISLKLLTDQYQLPERAQVLSSKKSKKGTESKRDFLGTAIPLNRNK